MLTDEIISALTEKENIANLIFPNNEVLASPKEISKRRMDIERGLLMGNGFRSKVLIYFRDAEKLRKVETTIWGVTDVRVLLKNNTSIPLQRIVKIEIQNESLKYPNI